MPPRSGRSSQIVPGLLDETDDLAVNLRDELDGLGLVLLLRLTYVVEEPRFEEGQDPADDPAVLIRVSVRPNDRHVSHARDPTTACLFASGLRGSQTNVSGDKTPSCASVPECPSTDEPVG